VCGGLQEALRGELQYVLRGPLKAALQFRGGRVNYNRNFQERV
jgi:hypothetical protein